MAGTITGKDKFVSGSNVAVTGAKTEKDNEINRIYYRILVENPSLSPAANVAVMDELPHTDDWRNDSSTRGSKGCGAGEHGHQRDQIRGGRKLHGTQNRRRLHSLLHAEEDHV